MSIGAFASHARKYFEAGLCVTPTAGPDGKRPILRGYPNRRLGPDEIDKIAARHQDANVAIVTGLSKLAVIDVDDPDEGALGKALDRFGQTPLITKTAGRGGFQAFYRGAPNLRPHDFRHSEGLPMELRTDGNIVVVPPSVNHVTGRQYQFISGSIEDSATLPVIDTTTLTQVGVTAKLSRGLPEDKRRLIEIGERNNWLFRTCLRHAPACDDLDALLDVARTRNDEYFGVQLGDAEVVKTARSAWGYELRGENWVGRGARCPITLDELRALEALGSDATVLAIHLRLEHGARMARGETFALDTRAMAAAQTVRHWSRRKYRDAIEALLTGGVLVCTWRGTGRGDPSQYRITMTTPRR